MPGPRPDVTGIGPQACQLPTPPALGLPPSLRLFMAGEEPIGPRALSCSPSPQQLARLDLLLGHSAVAPRLSFTSCAKSWIKYVTYFWRTCLKRQPHWIFINEIFGKKNKVVLLGKRKWHLHIPFRAHQIIFMIVAVYRTSCCQFLLDTICWCTKSARTLVQQKVLSLWPLLDYSGH